MSVAKRLIIDSGKPVLLTFDAFGTLFKPRESIACLYAQGARRHGLSGFSDKEIGDSFRKAYKAEYARNPNYGKEAGMNPSTWWANVIQSTLSPHATSSSLPEGLVTDLWDLFSSKRGYDLYPDVLPFFQYLRKMRISQQSPTITTGIITNSDDRVPSILSSLGLRVSPNRYGASSGGKTQLDIGATDIDFVTMSYDTGLSKPSREIYEAAFQLSGLASLEDSLCVHVGDDVDQDYHGALNAGWQGVLLKNRDGPNDDTKQFEEDNVVYIRDLLELKELLDPVT